MTLKKHILTGLAIIALQQIHGQQLPQYSQYMQNMYVLNPAASSLYHDVDINLGFRQQWAGFDGAPQTYYASGTVNLGKIPKADPRLYSIPISHRQMLARQRLERKNKHVVGGMAALDEYGAFQKSSFMVSYAFHKPIGDSYTIAVGTSLGWYGLRFAKDDVVLENPNDRTYNDFILNGTRSNLFDINAGLYVYSDRAFLGYSVYQLAQNEMKLGNGNSPLNLSHAKLAIHHFATLGYSIPLSQNFNLVPSMLFKILGPAPLSFDTNLKAEFMDRYWIGLSYRNEDAVAILLGAEINDWMKFGYSYDYVTSEINNASSGSHELVLSFQFDRKSPSK